MRFATLESLLSGHPRPCFIEPSASLREAGCRLQENDLRALVVVAKAPIVHILTDRHIWESVVVQRRDANAVTAREVGAPIESFASTTTLGVAWERVRQKKLAWIAVRDGDRVIALVSRTEMLDLVVRSQEAEVDCAIQAVRQFAFSNRRPC